MAVTECNVDLEDKMMLQHYDKLLNRFKEWIEFKREVKIIGLLENKRIQYDIENINSSTSATIFGYMKSKKKEKITTRSIVNSMFIVTDIQFILKDNLIESVKVKIRSIDKKLDGIIENCPDINLKIKQHIEEDSVCYFYIDFDDFQK